MACSSILIACLLVTIASADKPELGFPGFTITPVERTNSSNRIVGGENAQPGEFPHQVSLQWGLPPILPLSHLCGGSIINENWVMTAAHCPKGVLFGGLWVKAGKHYIGTYEQSEQTVRVSKSYVHPEYPGGVTPFDIALLRLSSPLKLNKLVQPIAIPKPDSIPKGDVVLSGWGSISTSNVPILPDSLQKATLPVVDYDECKKALDALAIGDNPLHVNNVCTGPLDGGVSACSGDSGSPLIRTNEEGKPEVIGIVSWGITPCGSEGAPSVYTRVSAYNSWIESIMASYS
ncbi:hypothetical protein QAD02_023068 [Eretmocerus hayati]|uniref:Uncharacterized protein n=1 Tax=Eretmocerus hayati TaxID=131215 RepID=A0ACC2PX98_9HYME|nr:hypothetical protein QAD02_023068 [Eretmocerus hayati]